MNIKEAIDWIDLVGPLIPRKEHLKVGVCCGFTEISEVRTRVLVGNYPILVGSQDLSPFREGPFTGEESAKELKGLADLAILGHSERREYFHETDDLIAKKTKRAMEAGILPLLCVQETSTPIPDGVTLVAFEPISAIGSGKPDSPKNADQVAASIIQKHANIEVLYGGSVTSKNAKSYLSQKHISGLLIGGASLDAGEFLKIVKALI